MVRPKLDISIPYDWMPFIGTSYEEQFKDTDIAFAYYEDSNYGKCKGNYKVKTYMSAGCAVVTSPVGYNKVLIKDGETGFFALTDDEWFQKLVFLLQNDCVCLKIRKNARKFVVNNYSYGVLLKKYLNILRKYNYL
jgi:glycosyltransferase involved in cell wall biosynthesis